MTSFLQPERMFLQMISNTGTKSLTRQYLQAAPFTGDHFFSVYLFTEQTDKQKTMT